MTTEACHRYLRDPEANAGHLAECAECRALFGPAEVPVEAPRVDLEALPLASWEGASHRAWLLVLGALVSVLALASALFVVTGVSPSKGLAGVVRGILPPAGLIRSMPRVISEAALNAPTGWQIAIGVGFVAVNTALYFLLRRSPKGIDV